MSDVAKNAKKSHIAEIHFVFIFLSLCQSVVNNLFLWNQDCLKFSKNQNHSIILFRRRFSKNFTQNALGTLRGGRRQQVQSWQVSEF